MFRTSSFYSVVELTKWRPDAKSKIAPFTVRLTYEERAKLENESGEMPLGAYVRSRIFDASLPQRKTRNKHPVKDRQALSRLLAELGNARLANNLNQLAKAVNSGSLPVTAETEAEIREAYAGIMWMRQTLITALALQAGDNP